jgi:purine-binding chemotaxis protein CheW
MATRRAPETAPSRKKPTDSPVRPHPSHTGSPEGNETGATARRGLATTADDDPHATGAGTPQQHLTFFLAGEEYGIGILRAREILGYEPLTRVPTMPPWIRGVMNLRGRVVPVVDLALKLGLDETRVTERTCIIIVEIDLDGESSVMGILADAVNQVVVLGRDQIEEPPAFGTRVSASFLAGMGQLEGRFILLLDVDRALSIDELLGPPSTAEPPGDGSEAPGRP